MLIFPLVVLMISGGSLRKVHESASNSKDCLIYIRQVFLSFSPYINVRGSCGSSLGAERRLRVQQTHVQQMERLRWGFMCLSAAGNQVKTLFDLAKAGSC